MSGNISGNYILGTYFNASLGNSENPTIGQIWTQNTTDNYLRKSTPAHFISQLGLVTGGPYLPLSGGTLTGPLTIGTTVNSTIWNDGTGTYMENTGTTSANRVIRLQAHNGSFSYTQLFVNGGGGYVEVNNQMRAPIFYDSQDTAYYLDPNSTGLSLSSNGIVSSGAGTSGGFQNRVYVGGRNRIWSFGNADGYGISYFQGGPDYIGLHVSGTPTQAGSDFWVSSTGIAQASASMRAPIFYDSEDTSYYVDPNGTSNLLKLSGRTMAYNDMNPMSANSPYVARYNGSAQYRNGTMGFGTVDFNVILSNWGSGFIDTWSNPGNAPGGSSHYVGLQSFHYNFENSSQAYGFQMACAGEADNRFFWRSAWPNVRSWVEMIHSGNIGSQSVSYANSAGSATNSTNTTNISLISLGNGSVNVNNGASAVYRNENGNGGNYPYAPVLHLGGGDTMWQIQGNYAGQTGLQWRSGYAGTWYAWWQILHSANYNSYSPTLTGGGASGTWGINAATATAAQNATFLTQPNATWGGRVQLGGNGGGGAATVAVVQATNGNLHMDAGSGNHIYLNYYNNGVIYLNGGTYNISANGSQYNGNAATASTASGQNSGANFTINTGGAGYGLVGVYNPAVHQGLFAMGAAYTLSAGGGLGNFYGVSWSYDGAGYAITTGYNIAHCLAVANAGTVYTVIGVGIWTSGLIRANGAISSGSTMTATGFFESSDSRFKQLIQDDYRAVGVQNIKPKLYIKDGKEEVGYFAQDFQSVLSSAVSENKEGFLNLSYTQVHTVKIAHLEDSVEEIKAKILYLENQLKQKQ